MFYLFLFVLIVFFAIFLILKGIKKQSAPASIENLTTFLISVSKYRKKDGKLVRGDCAFAFNESLFIIRQENEQIENNVDSIYYFDIWKYKDETYFKIVMRSHLEYTFKSIYFESDKIANYLRTKGVKIEDNRE